MDKKEKMIKQAIKAHNVDVPILRTRLVGNRLEMYLYGGQVITYEQDTTNSGKTQQDDSPIDLMSMTLAQLRKMAKAQGIKGYSSMKKSVLVGLLAKG